MPSQKNIDQVNDLKEKLEKSKAVLLADYAGLSVSSQTELRKKINEANGQLVVAKNRLFKIAYQEAKHLAHGTASPSATLDKEGQLKTKDKSDSSELKHKDKKPHGNLPTALEEALQGPTAFLFAYQDEISPIKALFEFSNENNLPKTKLAIMLEPTDRILSLEEVEQLAKLPSRDQLIAKIIGTLNNPAYRLVNALSGNIRKLTVVIKAISDKKSATLKS